MSEPTKIFPQQNSLEQENELLRQTVKYLTRSGGILRELSSLACSDQPETSSTSLSSYSDAAKLELDMVRQNLSKIKIDIDDTCGDDYTYFKEHYATKPLCSEGQLEEQRDVAENDHTDKNNTELKIPSKEIPTQNDDMATSSSKHSTMSITTSGGDDQTEHSSDNAFEPYENIDGFIESVLAKIHAAKKNIIELGNVDPFASSNDDIRRQEETLARLFADTESSDDEDVKVEIDSAKMFAPTL